MPVLRVSRALKPLLHCCPAAQSKLNKGIDTVHLDDILVDLKLTPDVLEVPVPRYILESRAKVCGGNCAAQGLRPGRPVRGAGRD